MSNFCLFKARSVQRDPARKKTGKFGFTALIYWVLLSLGTATLSMATNVGGFIYCDYNNSNSYNSGEALPVSGLTVKIYNRSNGSLLKTVTTNSSGYYSADPITDGLSIRSEIVYNGNTYTFNTTSPTSSAHIKVVCVCDPENANAPPFCAPTLTCPSGSGSLNWSQTINAANGTPAVFRLIDGGTETFTLPITLPTAFSNAVTVTISEAIAWDGYAGRNSVSQPNERYRLVFLKNNVIQATTNFTGDVADNKTQAYWKGGLGTVYLPNGADAIKVVHWGASTANGGQNDNSNPNSVVPTGICMKYTVPTTTNCPCPSGNLVTNPNFSSNTSGWSTTNGQLSYGTGGAFGGFLVLNNNDLSGNYFVYQDITLGAGKYYNFTGKAAKHSGSNAKVFLEFYNGSTKIGYTPDFFVTKNFDGNFQDIPTVQGFTPPSTTKIRIVGYANGTALKLDNLVLTTCNDTPTVTVSKSGNLTCVNNSVTVTATATSSSPITYSWTVPSGVTNPGNVASFSTTKAGTYTVSVTIPGSGSGCSATASTTVTENKTNPTVSLNSPVLTCASPSQTLTATASPSTGVTYAWT
ncbi:SdrD B-like domain-containing protein, partial [Arundinibacter roseus]